MQDHDSLQNVAAVHTFLTIAPDYLGVKIEEETMIRFIYGQELAEHPELRASMHLDRAHQFKDRLGWNVDVRENGQEHDEYDALNPLYVIVEDPNGLHAGSMRLLPTTGQTMVNDHFAHLTNGIAISSRFIWECTRLCLSKHAPRTVAPQLLAAGAKLLQECEIDHLIGVFDIRMLKIYQRIGASPTLLGTSCASKDDIGVGLWGFDEGSFGLLCMKGQLSQSALQMAFDCSLLGTNSGKCILD